MQQDHHLEPHETEALSPSNDFVAHNGSKLDEAMLPKAACKPINPFQTLLPPIFLDHLLYYAHKQQIWNPEAAFADFQMPLKWIWEECYLEEEECK